MEYEYSRPTNFHLKYTTLELYIRDNGTIQGYWNPRTATIIGFDDIYVW